MMINSRGMQIYQVSSESLDRFFDMLTRQEKLLKDLEKRVKALDEYPHLGEWVTSAQAFELLPFKDARTLAKWVERGIIEAKSISENGRKKAYRKTDILHFAEKAEKYLKGY
ncbi:hypothetical protein [Phaeodactylibacter sp.]|uniref:hypothetical protein n=1 Tax=Phaeodactylibacter sp. TaxID=1940289 RepID=UPI0025FFD180|nr:hypothetical protein [Phaeodactylibacter sp.]MCI5093483.1 hypothetical protein [Phaeodactylibacter sp.]